MNRVTLLGNKDHGKSTLVGSLLIETGSASQQRINDAKKTSEKLGRRFEPGYILDSFQEEREKEMTIDTTRAQIRYKKTGFEFIDVPGHEEFMKNMLSGASYADFALLIVSAKPDEGITTQTKRHLFVAKMLGINKLVVAINKLDAVGYNEERFGEIREDIGSYLDRIGFSKEWVSFVPISAYDAVNLIKPSKKTKWYNGKSLMDMLVTASKVKKNDGNNNTLIIQLQGLFNEDKKLIFGKVLSGRASEGDMVFILPSGKEAGITKIFVSGRRKHTAEAGNAITLELDRKIGKDIKGKVASSSKDACHSGNLIHAMLLTTRRLKGKPSIKINGVEVGCKKVKVTKEIDVATGECVASSKIRPLDAGSVELELDRNVATNRFDKIPEIGRFVFYIDGAFSGIGIITE